MPDLASAFTLHSKNRIGPRRGEPTVTGIPVARGSYIDSQQLHLIAEDNSVVPCDVTILDRWPDKSGRWILLAFRAYTEKSKTRYGIRITPPNDSLVEDTFEQALQIRQMDVGFIVDTGTISISIGPGARWPIRRVLGAKNEDWLDATGNGLELISDDGNLVPFEIKDVSIESAGMVHATVKGFGAAALKSHKRLEIDWRIEFFAGLPLAIIHVTIRNPHRAHHPSGYWELGDPGSIFLREMSFRAYAMNPASKPAAWISPKENLPLRPVELPFELYQDSSGGENWQHRNHINRNGIVPLKFRGYRCSDDSSPSGFRACPIAAFDTACGQILLGSKHFWQNFPKAIELSTSGITYGLFPRQSNDLFELQGGEQKTHSFAISFGSDAITNIPLDWFRQPLVPSINPNWAAQSHAIDYLIPSSEDPHKVYLDLANSALEGNDTFENKREAVDEYGWRNFGDIYADHETVHAPDSMDLASFVSHYNNQYDAIAGLCYQWLRSGIPKWYEHLCDLAQHVVDIDIYHTDEDKSAYNHGLFWHTYHYVDAGRSTHRAYPSIRPSNGGGPANEHIYTTGLMLHYFITGNTASRDAALELAQFIIDIDDGTKTPFRWLARGYTGLASASRSADYHGPGRGSGNSLNALLDAHRLTSDNRFLDKAEQIIRRVTHPEEDISRHNLLDAENRWFYTIYLQALGKYLDYKALSDQLDSMYAYAKETLLHYARWMAKNEYPFLEKPEILEYPTETWAAQDMRKSEVFKYACMYSQESEQKLFWERAVYFFGNSINSLAGFSTKTLCRPVVILLSYGWTHAFFAKHGCVLKPTAEMPKYWPPQENFVPLKSRASKNALLVALAGVVLIALVAAIAFTQL